MICRCQEVVVGGGTPFKLYLPRGRPKMRFVRCSHFAGGRPGIPSARASVEAYAHVGTSVGNRVGVDVPNASTDTPRGPVIEECPASPVAA